MSSLDSKDNGRKFACFFRKLEFPWVFEFPIFRNEKCDFMRVVCYMVAFLTGMVGVLIYDDSGFPHLPA